MKRQFNSQVGDIVPNPKAVRPASAGPGRSLWLPALALLAPALSLSQVDRPEPRKLWALLIGVSKYTHVEPLRFAASDARAVRDFLASPRGGSVPADQIVMLLEGEATREAVLTQVEQLQEKVQDGDTIYIYVAGHGYVTPRGIGYFIPADGRPATPAATSVSFSTFKELVEVGLAHAKSRIVITDMCRAGKFGPDKSDLAERIENFVNEELAKFGKGRGGSFLNLLASRSRQNSYERDELGHGVFTHALLEALNGKAATGGASVVTATDTVQFVQEEVPKYTANQQQPMANRDFDPAMPLSFPNLPGPETGPATPSVTLLITRADRTSYSRLEWDDAKSGSRAVALFEKDKEALRISSLPQGELALYLFDADGRAKTVKVRLSPGENQLDLSTATLGLSGPRRLPDARLASIAPMIPLIQASQPSADSEAVLIVRTGAATELHVDGGYYGTSGPDSRPLQVRGLSPGSHYLRLVPSPEKELRFRVRLFPGPQVFDPGTGEIRYFAELPEAPAPASIPAALPADLRADYLRFSEFVWRGRLIAPSGACAFDLYRQMQARMPPGIRDDMAVRLAVALGDRASGILLQYVRGGDFRWTAEMFDEGRELSRRAGELRGFPARHRADEYFFAGRSAVERGEYSRAVEDLNRSLQLDPEASHALNAIGLAWWKQNRLDEAIPLFQRASALSPFWNYPRVTLALIYLEQRRYREAEESFRQALRIDSDDSTARHGLGQLHLMRERWDDARSELERALESNPGNAYACETLGRLHQARRSFGNAEQMFRLAIRLEPDEPSFRASLADLLRQLGRNAEAGQLLARVSADHPADLRIVRVYSDYLSGTNRHAEAESLFQRALRASPDDANLRLLYASLLRERDRPADAEEQLRRAVRSAPGNAHAHHELASLLLQLRRVADAERELDAALRSDPRLPAPLRLKGQLELARKRYPEAIGSFRRALEHSTRARERQELEELVAVATDALAAGAIQGVRDKAGAGSPKEAWAIASGALALAPTNLQLRDAILQLQGESPAAADPESLPPGPLADVLKSGFWRARTQAESLWAQGRRADAAALFGRALGELRPAERRPIASTSFNAGNARYGIHELVYRWIGRTLELRDIKGATSLWDAATGMMLFATVPGVEPVTVDSLMWPDDAANPAAFRDFEVARHPDRRAHEIHAALRALQGDAAGAEAYLAALEKDGPDPGARLYVAIVLDRFDQASRAVEVLARASEGAEQLKPSESLADALLKLADLQCRTGACERGRETLRRSEKLFPGNPRILEALRRYR